MRKFLDGQEIWVPEAEPEEEEEYEDLDDTDRIIGHALGSLHELAGALRVARVEVELQKKLADDLGRELAENLEKEPARYNVYWRRNNNRKVNLMGNYSGAEVFERVRGMLEYDPTPIEIIDIEQVAGEENSDPAKAELAKAREAGKRMDEAGKRFVESLRKWGERIRKAEENES